MKQYLYYFYCNSFPDIFSLDKENAHRERPSQTRVLFIEATTSSLGLRERRHPLFFKLTSCLFYSCYLRSFWLYCLQKDNAIHSRIPVVFFSNRSSISLLFFCFVFSAALLNKIVPTLRQWTRLQSWFYHRNALAYLPISISRY